MPASTHSLPPPTVAQLLWPRPAMRPAAAATRDALLALAMSIVVALSAQVTIPLPLVPITGQTFAVLLAGALLGPRLGALALCLYLAEGLVGLPVFSGGRSAWSPSPLPLTAEIVGPTAGYLFSYPLAAAAVGLLTRRGGDRRVLVVLGAMLAGSLVIYTGGALWLARFVGLPHAVAVGVVPFIIGDAVKALFAAALLPLGWRMVGRRG